MFTIETVETPDRILVTGRGDGGFCFFWVSFRIRGLDMVYKKNFFRTGL